ncbi:hypothetical protein MASR2M8_19040 [Opitutaceae bacterium]
MAHAQLRGPPVPWSALTDFTELACVPLDVPARGESTAYAAQCRRLDAFAPADGNAAREAVQNALVRAATELSAMLRAAEEGVAGPKPGLG